MKTTTTSGSDSPSATLCPRVRGTPSVTLAALALAFTVSARAETPPAAIPFSDIGARATASYQGDVLGITATADGARLRCGFQKLEGHATPEGLWLESTATGGGRLRLVAVAVGRGGSRAPQCALTEPASSVRSAMSIVTDAHKLEAPLGVPCNHAVASIVGMPLLTELETTFSDVPCYKHAAPNGAAAWLGQGTQTLACTGEVSVADKVVRFTRPGLTEQYSVSVDGVRQDFIIESAPLNPHPLRRAPAAPESPAETRSVARPSTLDQPAGDLRVELALSGARAEATATGARLRVEGSGRALAYGRLRAEDATGRELTARLEVLSADRLALSVADANATYPVRIDPTFSDADWVSLNPGLPGADNVVLAMAVDGSGNVYAGGDFTFIGTVPANHIAKWDGSAWSALGSGMNGDVYALAVSGTDLYAGGLFTTAGGVPANYIAKWDGSAWSALGSGLSDDVFALAASGTNLYTGGGFTTAGGVPANYIAKWDGRAWSALGSGMNGDVFALAVSGTGLYAGGWFTTAGLVTAQNIAKWDGSAWSPLGAGLYGRSQGVKALVVSGTDVYAGGDFTAAGGVTATNIAKWDGNAWSALGSGLSRSDDYDSEVFALTVSGTNLYAGGYFSTAGGVPANHIAKWNGSTWSVLGLGVSSYSSPEYSLCPFALAVSGANLYAGGQFTTAGGVPANCIAKWNGSTWSALGSGMNGEVYALAVSGTDLYAGGLFTTAGGVPANYIAKWDGSAWSALGSGMSGRSGYSVFVPALAVSGTDLYAGGQFTTAGGVPATNIAKWDGRAWSALGSGLDNFVNALAVSGTNLYAGGWFMTAGGVPANNIAKWDGNAWSALGSGLSEDIFALAVSGTDLYAGGWFTTAGGVTARHIAKWDGSTWSALGSGMNGDVHALAVSGTDLYVGGYFTTAGGMSATNIAKWDGRAWSALGSGLDNFVDALAVRGTNLYAGGFFGTAGGVPADNIAKWDGRAWSALGSGVDGEVCALGVSGPNLYVGGLFYLAGTNVSPYIAEAILAHAPTVLASPETQTAEAGATVTLTVDATGVPPPTYQWYFNGTHLLSCTKPDLALTSLLLSQSGAYTVVVINEAGAVTSAPVLLNVIPPVQRRPVPGVRLGGASGGLLNVDYANALNPVPAWNPLGSVSLTSPPQYWFDMSQPLAPQRFYRAWQMGTPGVKPLLDLQIVPAITLTGSIGDSVRVDGINRFGLTDAWFTLDTVMLTNTSQLYFDTSAWQQPSRLYRVVQMP